MRLPAHDALVFALQQLEEFRGKRFVAASSVGAATGQCVAAELGNDWYRERYDGSAGERHGCFLFHSESRQASHLIADHCFVLRLCFGESRSMTRTPVVL